MSAAADWLKTLSFTDTVPPNSQADDAESAAVLVR